MNYIVTKYPQGTFSWADVSTTDIKKTKDFLTSLFGWTAEDMPTGQPGMSYTMFYLNGKTVAGAGQKMPGATDPSYWGNYVTVNNIEAMTKKAESLGAKVIFPPMDIYDSGKMSGFADPEGAVLMLWQPLKHIGAQVVNTAGSMGWNELYARDLEQAKKFYGALFGWTFDTEDGYTTIKNEDRMNGGIMTITPEMEGMPANWMTYFTVKSLEEAGVKVKKLGGTVHMTKDISVGKIGMVTEPTGAKFIIIELSMQPEEWKE